MLALLFVAMGGALGAEGLESAGNTDGLLTWRLGALEPGKSASETVVFAFADSRDKLLPVLKQARAEASRVAPLAAAPNSAAPPKESDAVWIKNALTDFALDAQGSLFWEKGQRQALACSHGGQLSRFSYFLRYDSDQTRQAGVPIAGDDGPLNLRTVEPVRAVDATQAAGAVETADGMLRVAIRAVMGSGAAVAVQFTVTNVSKAAVGDVRLSVYANLEAAHTHENDYSTLDKETGGLLTVDPPTGMCVLMAGLTPPADGFSGVWPSERQLRECSGVAFNQWKPFAGLSEAAQKQAKQPPPRRGALPHEIAPAVADPQEPETRTLAPAEADAVLVRDWLFQAGNNPSPARVRQEIEWARMKAARFERAPKPPDLSAELKELDALERSAGGSAAGSRRDAGATGEKKELPAGLLGRWTSRDLADGNFKDAGPKLAAISTGSYTLCAWIKTASGEADIIGNGVTSGHFLLMTYQGVARAHQWTSESANVLDGQTKIADERWHHLAQVVDGDTLSLFVDGKPDGSLKLLGAKTAAEHAVTVGSRGLQHRTSFAGDLDEVCVFGRALSPDELRNAFGTDKPPEAQPVTPARDAYLAVRRVKRRIMFKNPAVDFDAVAFIDNPYPQGSEWPHQARHRDSMMAMPGGRLLALEGLEPGGKVRKLAPDKPGSFWRFDLSFDAKKVLYCCWQWDGKGFHLYEMNLDGTGTCRQLTSGDYDETDPIYLPDGHIMFTTTRCNTYVRCMPYTFSYVLARCDADGGNIYLVSQNSEPDWLPTLLNDGRVIYSRWEYTDKALWRIQSLWTVNPDGTNVTAFWGNQSVWPDHLAEPRPIPNSRRVMFTGLAHHDWFAGSVGILDQTKGYNFPHGLTKVTADVAWPECGTPPVDPAEAVDYHRSGSYDAYKTPYPLSEEDFLVSARGGGKYRLYLMDVHGNRELIYEGAHHIWHAMPVKPRVTPPVIADRVAWPGTGADRREPEPGVLFSANVYQGARGIPPGAVKYLRVFQMDPKTYSLWTRDSRYEGPAVSVIQAEGVKRILGTVPVEPDGSVAFKVPPGKALYFQILDEHYRALQTMRSFTGMMPGERRGCVGCHELHSAAPAGQPSAALRKAPPNLTPPPWGTRSLSYERMIQPVLDKNCGKCHQGDGKARAKLDMTLRPGNRAIYKEPYLSFVSPSTPWNWAPAPGPKLNIAGAILCENYGQSDPASYTTLPPMQYLSYRSKLIENAMDEKHHESKLDPNDLLLLISWIDANCPYRGDEDVRALPDPDYPGFERLPVRPLCKSAPVVPRP